MAKRKTPKAEKVIDLTPKPDKITDVQLNKVQSTVRTMDSVIMELGRMAVQRHGTLKGLENIQIELDNLREELKKEYGTDNINVQDGTIGYPPENPNPKENGKTDKED